MSLSIVVPTLNAAADLPGCMAALAEGRAAGLVDEILVADGGSRDDTATAAAAAGARVVRGPRGRGPQLAAGAAAAAGDWLLFLHADTRLAPGWSATVGRFMAAPENAERAGYFRLRFDDTRAAARRLERIVAWRCRRLGLPYGDQGLVIRRAFYDRLGGYRPLALMEDVDLVRRIGRARLAALPVDAVTSARRYQAQGFVLRPLRNLLCLGLYLGGAPLPLVRRLYG